MPPTEPGGGIGWVNKEKMDNDISKRILAENQEIIVRVNNQLGLYIKAGNMQAFQVLTRAVNQIIDQRQAEITNKMKSYESED